MDREEPNVGDFINVLTKVDDDQPPMRVDAIIYKKAASVALGSAVKLFYIYKNPLIQSENVFKYDSVNIASYDYYVLNKPGTRYIDDILGGQLTNEAEMPGPFSIPRINGGKKSKRRHNRKSKRRHNMKSKRRHNRKSKRH